MGRVQLLSNQGCCRRRPMAGQGSCHFIPVVLRSNRSRSETSAGNRILPSKVYSSRQEGLGAKVYNPYATCLEGCLEDRYWVYFVASRARQRPNREVRSLN